MKHILTRTQAAIFMELKNSKKPLHVYAIMKSMEEKGIKCSHQMLYRDARKMPLGMKTEPIEGKPDRKVYSLKKGVEYVIPDDVSMKFIIAYGDVKAVKDRILKVTKQIESINAIEHECIERETVLSSADIYERELAFFNYEILNKLLKNLEGDQ